MGTLIIYTAVAYLVGYSPIVLAQTPRQAQLIWAGMFATSVAIGATERTATPIPEAQLSSLLLAPFVIGYLSGALAKYVLIRTVRPISSLRGLAVAAAGAAWFPGALTVWWIAHRQTGAG